MADVYFCTSVPLSDFTHSSGRMENNKPRPRQQQTASKVAGTGREEDNQDTQKRRNRDVGSFNKLDCFLACLLFYHITYIHPPIPPRKHQKQQKPASHQPKPCPFTLHSTTTTNEPCHVHARETDREGEGEREKHSKINK